MQTSQKTHLVEKITFLVDANKQQMKEFPKVLSEIISILPSKANQVPEITEISDCTSITFTLNCTVSDIKEFTNFFGVMTAHLAVMMSIAYDIEIISMHIQSKTFPVNNHSIIGLICNN